MPAEKTYNSYLDNLSGAEVLEMYRKDPKILENIDLFFVPVGRAEPEVKISIPKIYVSRFRFFGQDIDEIGAGFADEKIRFEVGLSPDYFGPGQIEDFVQKFVDIYFYDKTNLQRNDDFAGCAPLLYWAATVKFINQYVFEKSSIMKSRLISLGYEIRRYERLTELFDRFIKNEPMERWHGLNVEDALILNKDARNVMKIYFYSAFHPEYKYYDFETCECISHPGTPRADSRLFDDIGTYVIVFGDDPTHRIYTHDEKTYPNVKILLQKIKNEAPRLFGMLDEQSSRELACLLENGCNEVLYDDVGYACMKEGLLSALSRCDN